MVPGGSEMQKSKPKLSPPPAGAVSVWNDLRKLLHDADVLLVVPPFPWLNYASLSLHILQACAREAGFRVQVLYANMLLAAVIGDEAYAKICNAPTSAFAAERFFARSAFGLPPLGRCTHHMHHVDWVIGPHKDWEITPDPFCFDGKKTVTLPELNHLERGAEAYIHGVAEAVKERGYAIVGCTTSFNQTVASVALLNQIKTLRKETVTVLGGANCQGEMARGLASLHTGIDYIFSGESEVTFPHFVRDIFAGLRPPSRIVNGKPCGNMDALPTPSYVEFYEQLRCFQPDNEPRQTEILCETSRGCWWGERHPCTFCGMSGEAMPFRQKSPSRVIEELHSLLETCPTRNVDMADCVMPYTYFSDLLPHLARKFPGVSFFYEQKANLSLAQLLALKNAGVNSIGPGVESLSTSLLTLMRKGLQARQNLMFLRNARAVDLNLEWNLLWGFPRDDVEAYREMLDLLPLLHHLQPPNAMVHLSIERFSPYYSLPREFGVRNIKPLAGYRDFFPKGTDIKSIAYHFTAEYKSGAHDHPEVIQELWRETDRWRAAWKPKDGAPIQKLELLRRNGAYLLVDTRDLWRRRRSYPLDEREASILMTSRPHSGHELETWAVQKKLAVLKDGWYVPLAVAEPDVLLKLTRQGDRNPLTS
jgi:ribosomal peptide maturation radical SAM protein 1